MVLDYKMCETGNRAELRDEAMLQFTQLWTDRWGSVLWRASFLVHNLGTTLIIGKVFCNVLLGGCKLIYWQIFKGVVNLDLETIQRSPRITLLCTII